MSRQIDLSKPLSPADEKYLRDRGRFSEIAQASGSAFAQAAQPEPEQQTDIADMTVADLKNELGALGEPLHGNKEELQTRLVEVRGEQE